jgi:hypothetical protein
MFARGFSKSQGLNVCVNFVLYGAEGLLIETSSKYINIYNKEKIYR